MGTYTWTRNSSGGNAGSGQFRIVLTLKSTDLVARTSQYTVQLGYKPGTYSGKWQATGTVTVGTLSATYDHENIFTSTTSAGSWKNYTFGTVTVQHDDTGASSINCSISGFGTRRYSASPYVTNTFSNASTTLALDTIEPKASHKAHIYTNDEWKTAKPYIYTNSTWTEVTEKIYTSSEWT